MKFYDAMDYGELIDTLEERDSRIAKLEAENKRLRDEMDSWGMGLALEEGE